MATEMQQYRGDAADWASANPVLADGELGFEQDTQILKIGDGVTAWNSLGAPPYIPTSLLTSVGDMIVATGPGTLARLGQGTPGQTLTVQSDGTLAWADQIVIADLESSSHAYSTYMTKNAETVLDADFEQADHASTTYITNSLAASQHSGYDTLDHMDATYLSKARGIATYEPKMTLKVKSTSTTKTLTSTLTLDPDLYFPVIAGSVYIFEMGLFLSDPSGGEYKFGVPAGLASVWYMGIHGGTLSISGNTGDVNHRMMGNRNNEPTTFSIGGATAFTFASIKGYVAASASGNFGLTWAQSITFGSPGTSIYKGSYLKAVRIA